MRYFLFIILFSGGVLSYGQESKATLVDGYWEMTMSAHLWNGSNKTVGIQTSGGLIFNRKTSIGVGFGVGSRNYEYVTVPFEIGRILWEGNGALRVYGGPTYETYSSRLGFLGGTEIIFRPRFERRSLKLVLALGIAFDRSGPDYFIARSSPISEEKTTLPGPRLRIGLGL